MRAMNFFEHQEAARRRTSLLVGYYALAVGAIIVSLYAVALTVFRQGVAVHGSQPADAPLWDPGLFAVVALGVGGLILIGTLYKIATLRGGGEAVATMLGGRPVAPNTTDLHERRLLNIVEEMAVASGTPIPRVFVLDDEQAINAFAAGFTPADAVVTVTRGTLEKLTRDELQGVIAHEFSHIFNGDMRLNIRLMGVLYGILVLSLAGYWMFRITANTGSGSRSRKEKGNALGAIVILGLAMWIIGYIGVIFARLIKSAVSRQREYLADASAVQFTRNPLGIGGALKKIGGFAAGSRLLSPHAEQASHLFFANGLRDSVFGLMATHPPLVERIRRIDPQFDGNFAATAGGDGLMESDDAPAGSLVGVTPVAPPPLPTAAQVAIRPGAIVNTIGTLPTEGLAYAAGLLSAIPAPLRMACRETDGAQAVVYGLLLSQDAAVRAAQRDQIAAAAPEDVTRRLDELAPHMAAVSPETRLPLADVAIATLRHLPADGYAALRTAIFALAAADDKITIFEYAVMRLLTRRLDAAFGMARRPVVRYTTLEPLLADCDLVLSGLAWFGSDSAPEAQQAFAQGLAELGCTGRLELRPQKEATLTALDPALDRLAQATPPLKQKILAAAAACVSADGRVTVDEAEALHAVADTLGCPMPPLMAQAA